MPLQYIVRYISAAFFRIIKITTVVIRDHSVFECQFQICILQSFQIYPAYMKYPRCTFKYRRGKHFSHRNIDIRNTVFENRLFLRIFELMQRHSDISPVLSLALHTDILSLVKGIDDCLLYLFIKLCIQCVDAYHFIKYFRIIFPDLRHRIRYDRKAALLPSDILICNLTGAAVIADRHFFLFVIIGRCFRNRFR